MASNASEPGHWANGAFYPICATNYSNPINFTGDPTALDDFGGPATFSIGCIGIILDILAVFVLANQKPPTSTSFILTALSLSDSFEIIQLLTSTASSPLGQIFEKYIYKSKINPFAFYTASITRWTNAFGQIAVLFNRGILIILATERYIAVCHPLKASSLCTRKRAIQAVVFWAFCSVILSITRFFEMSGVACYDVSHDLVRPHVDNLLKHNPHYTWLMKTLWPILVTAIIPFIILLVMNIMIVLTLIRSGNIHQNAASQQSAKKQDAARRSITIMSILICCLFMLLMIPYIATRLYSTIIMTRLINLIKSGVRPTPADLPNRWVLQSLSIWLILNNSLNFLIYCCMSTRFRNSFKRIFGLQSVFKGWRRGEAASDRTGGTSLITRETVITRYDYFKRQGDNTPAGAKGESQRRDTLPKSESQKSRNQGAPPPPQRGDGLQMERLNATQGDPVSEDPFEQPEDSDVITHLNSSPNE